MKASLRSGLVCSILAIVGCGGAPRLDATSMESFEASKKAMTADMTDAQKRQFATDTMAALGPEAVQANMKNTFSKDKTAASQTEMYKPLQGMTALEIQAKAEANRQKTKKR